MLRQYFKEQIETYAPVTEDVYERIEYKRVWSGNLIEVGDKVLFALVYPLNESDYKMMALLEREIEDLDRIFTFSHFEKETIPVLKYKGDTKQRT